MNINMDNVLEKEGYELCLEIEKFPASEQQTNISVMVNSYFESVKMVLEENERLEKK